MPPVPTDTLRSQASDRLMPHGSGGLRASLAGVVDLDALQQGQYDDVLESVDARLSTAQYSLVSMLVAGIYFGLLVGAWLVTTSTWPLIGRWLIPVLLVTVYAVYSSYQTVQEIRELSEARSLLHTLVEQSSSTTVES